MKKYSVFSLYVLKKDNHKFICQKIFDNEYREILTKTKMFVDNNKNVESLTNWYSLATIAFFDFDNNTIKNPKMLTKKDILLKYLEINEKDKNKEEKDRNVLWEEYVENFKDDVPVIPIISAKKLNKQKTLDKK